MWVKTIHIFAGDNRVEDDLFADVLWQRQLDQNAMHCGITVEFLDEIQQLDFGRLSRKSMKSTL